MTTKLTNELSPFIFPVKEEKIYYPDSDNKSLKTSDAYKSIVRTDTGQLISVMRDTYQLIPNRLIVESLISELETISCKHIIDKQHSYVDNTQMRLSLILPDYYFNDHESKIFLSLQLLNSYSGTVPYSRKIFLHRRICSNGMMAKELFNETSRKHTSNAAIDGLKNDISNAVKKFPILQMKIEEMMRTKVTKKHREQIRQRLGKTVADYLKSVENKGKDNLYDVYHHLTYWASHLCASKLQMQYHSEISKLFSL